MKSMNLICNQKFANIEKVTSIFQADLFEYCSIFLQGWLGYAAGARARGLLQITPVSVDFHISFSCCCIKWFNLFGKIVMWYNFYLKYVTEEKWWKNSFCRNRWKSFLKKSTYSILWNTWSMQMLDFNRWSNFLNFWCHILFL